MVWQVAGDTYEVLSAATAGIIGSHSSMADLGNDVQALQAAARPSAAAWHR